MRIIYYMSGILLFTVLSCQKETPVIPTPQPESPQSVTEQFIPNISDFTTDISVEFESLYGFKTYCSVYKKFQYKLVPHSFEKSAFFYEIYKDEQYESNAPYKTGWQKLNK